MKGQNMSHRTLDPYFNADSVDWNYYKYNMLSFFVDCFTMERCSSVFFNVAVNKWEFVEKNFKTLSTPLW